MTTYEVQPGSRIDRFVRKIRELTAADQARRQPLAERESELNIRRDAITARMATCQWPGDVAEYALLIPELELLDRELTRVRAQATGPNIGLQRLAQQHDLTAATVNQAGARLRILENEQHPITRAMTLDARDVELVALRRIIFENLDPAGMSEAPCGVARDSDGADIWI